MTDLRHKLDELRREHERQLVRVRRAQERADETQRKILAIQTVLQDVLGESVGPSQESVLNGQSPIGHAAPKKRTRQKESVNTVAGAVRVLIREMPFEFMADELHEKLTANFPQHSGVGDAVVRKALARFSKQGDVQVARPGRGRAPTIYRNPHAISEPEGADTTEISGL